MLTAALQGKQRLFSAAYIMPSGRTLFGSSRKHRTYLKLLEMMLAEDVPTRLMRLPSMQDGFHLLHSYPLIGDFLAYQYITDINYSQLTNFSEMEFVMPGPGARSGIRKCFSSPGDLQDIETPTAFDKIQEIEAQAFAAYFLMPLRLVNLQIARMHLSRSAPFTTQMVYQLSLRLGVSYSALAQHLVNLGKIKGQDAYTLQRQTPKSIKTALSGGIAPQNSWADVWSLGPKSHKENILLYVDDEVHIHLPEASLSNEIWHVDVSLNREQILLVREQRSIVPSENSSDMTHTFVFRMIHTGQYRLRIIKSHDTTGVLVEEPFEIQFSIYPKAGIGLDEQQHSRLRFT